MKYIFIVEVEANFEPATAEISEAIENGDYMGGDEDGGEISAKTIQS